MNGNPHFLATFLGVVIPRTNHSSSSLEEESPGESVISCRMTALASATHYLPGALVSGREGFRPCIWGLDKMIDIPGETSVIHNLGDLPILGIVGT